MSELSNPLIDELRWRGMLQDLMPGTEEQLNKELTTGYVGFDPTADSLHIGSLVPIILLVHLQRAGHKPIVLVGGATGMVGDPSGKSEERNMLSEETLSKNLVGIRRQLEQYLDFNTGKPTDAVLVNNYDWFKNISFLEFIRDAGKHITVNYMMAKDSVSKRLTGDAGMSFTEFTYQLVQGYDFWWLRTNMNCKLQMGGSDQWGNMVTGTELIRRKNGGDAFAFTCPLIKKADGGKFGKSEQGNVWLDPVRTTPYQFYQFWLNSSDQDAAGWIKIFTFLPQEEIAALETEHQRDPGRRILQKKLAEEVTVFVHGKAALMQALETTQKLFSAQAQAAEAMSEEDLRGIEGIVKSRVGNVHADIVTIAADAEIFSSKGEARKMIIGGGLSVNRRKISDPSTTFSDSDWLHGKYLLLQKGKKNFYLLEK